MDNRIAMLTNQKDALKQKVDEMENYTPRPNLAEVARTLILSLKLCDVFPLHNKKKQLSKYFGCQQDVEKKQ